MSQNNLYCTNCSKHTPHNPKLSALIDGCLVCDKCSKMNGFCSLIKIGDDNFEKHSKNVKWIEFEGDFGKNLHDKPKIGFSLIMSPFNPFSFTWMTSEITEIIEINDDFTHFKTKNSEYKLYSNPKLIEKYDKTRES
jgi:hypothetical protein